MKTWHTLVLAAAVVGVGVVVVQRGRKRLTLTNPGSVATNDVMETVSAGVRSIGDVFVTKDPTPAEILAPDEPIKRLPEEQPRSKPGMRYSDPTWEQFARSGVFH